MGTITLKKVKTSKGETYFRLNNKEKYYRISEGEYKRVIAGLECISSESSFVKGKCVNGSQDKSILISHLLTKN